MFLQKIVRSSKIYVLVVALTGVGIAMFLPNVALAAPKCAIVLGGPIGCPVNIGNGSNNCFVYDPGNPSPKGSQDGWVKTDCNGSTYKNAAKPPAALSTCNSQVKSGCQDPALNCTKNCDIVADYVNPLINVLAACVGIVVTISIVWAGIQYASSADDPQKVSQAKHRIMNSLIALISFFLFYAFLQWLIPGGFFN